MEGDQKTPKKDPMAWKLYKPEDFKVKPKGRPGGKIKTKSRTQKKLKTSEVHEAVARWADVNNQDEFYGSR